MRFNVYSDVKKFHDDVFDVLMRHEAQNMVPLGNLIIGAAGKDKTGWRDPANWLMAAVSDDSGVRLTAIMTPPHNIALHATDNIICGEALDCLIEGLAGHAIPGVISDKPLAEMFTEKYTAAKSLSHKIQMNQRIYELSEVNPDIAIVGQIRPVRDSDLPFVPYWIEAFLSSHMEVPTQVQPDIARYQYYINAGRLFILEVDGLPVSMAGITREMVNVCGVAQVYTPPYFRGRGYASSCVAAVSRIVLGRGYASCALYADLANPTSNSIYQKIGYKPVCDSLNIKFE